jgi:hypothetical protein
MYQKFPFKNIPPEKRRISSLRGRSLILAVLLAFVIGSAALTSPAAAKPSQAWVSAEIWLNLKKDITLCKGEKRTVVVELKVFTARLFGVIGGTSSSFPGQTIGANSSNTQVAAISPGFGTTVIYRANPNGFVPSATQFEIKGVDVGSSLLTFTDDSSPTALNRPVRPRADPERITVTVKECVFEVTAVSEWIVPGGFLLKEVSRFSGVVQPDRDGRFDEGNVAVANTARPQRFLAWCTHDVSAFASTVRIYGQVDWDARTIEVNLKYDTVQGKSDIVCQFPMRTISDDSAGFGTPFTITWIGSNDGFSTTDSHTLKSDRGTVDGTQVITVVRKYK